MWVCTGGSVAEQLGRSTCKLEAQSLSPALTASWSNVLSHPKFKSLTMVINSQLAGFLTPLCSISIICFRHLLCPTSTTSANTAKGKKQKFILYQGSKNFGKTLVKLHLKIE